MNRARLRPFRAGLPLALAAALLLASCARPPAPAIPPPPAAQDVQDVLRLSQDPTAYLDPATEDRPLLDAAQSAQALARFTERLYAPWTKARAGLPLQEVRRPFQGFRQKSVFGENTLVRPREWADRLESLAALDTYPSMARRAVTLRRTDLRQMPTDRPAFYDFAKAGEGFPFDYLQNSALWPGTPLFVTHATRDRSWYFCETPLAPGWIRAQDLAWTDPAFVSAWRAAGLAAVVSEDLPVTDEGGVFRFQTGIGAVHPLAGQTSQGPVILIPVADENGNALSRTALAPAEAVRAMPLTASARNVAVLARRMAPERGQADYGWGGLFGNRDCSAMLKDLFAPFGLWLPRNSAAQAKAGVYTPLDALPPAERERALLQQGLPFFTLVHLPGHIMLCIGQKDGRALVFHTIWGVRTQDRDKGEGRKVIGRAVVTTLEPGLELPGVDPKATLLARVKGMTLLAPAPGAPETFEETEVNP